MTTLRIHLNDEELAALHAEAAQRGRGVADYAAQLLAAATRGAHSGGSVGKEAAETVEEVVARIKARGPNPAMVVEPQDSFVEALAGDLRRLDPYPL